jgi:hypothetical protein
LIQIKKLEREMKKARLSADSPQAEGLAIKA